MNESATQEYDKRNRNSAGKLYIPSLKFGLELKDGRGVTHGGGAKSKQEALASAQQWALGEKGRSATVYRRCNPVCKGLVYYWNDGQLQFITIKEP